MPLLAIHNGGEGLRVLERLSFYLFRNYSRGKHLNFAKLRYTYVKQIDLPLPPELPTIYSTVYLQWCSSDQLNECRSLKIDWGGKAFPYRLSSLPREKVKTINRRYPP